MISKRNEEYYRNLTDEELYWDIDEPEKVRAAPVEEIEEVVEACKKHVQIVKGDPKLGEMDREIHLEITRNVHWLWAEIIRRKKLQP